MTHSKSNLAVHNISNCVLFVKNEFKKNAKAEIILTSLELVPERFDKLVIFIKILYSTIFNLTIFSMFYGNTPEDTRRFFFDSWQKHLEKQPLMPVEQQVVHVILQHPEYHRLLNHKESCLTQSYFPEQGETNPFLHMGLHLAVKDQIAMDRPEGILSAYRQLLKNHDEHQAEHQVMECLAECLWQSQKTGSMPDENAYLSAVCSL